MNMTQITKDFLAAREAVAAAEAAKKRAEAALKEALARAGVNYAVADGQKVTVTSKGRSNYDTDALFAMVSANLFDKVTKPTVDAKKFRAAVELGEITPEVADAVTSVTAYDEVRVTVLAESAADDSQIAKIA